MLADMMLNGRGGPKDHPAALVLFEKAATQGHTGAMFAVGAMLGGGHDVPWDRVAARHWFRTAAEKGHPYAQMMLGRYLARGLGGEQNIEQARRWTERAVAQGLQEAKADLAALPAAPTHPPSVHDNEEKTVRAAGD
jgi:TPR repeat protein